MTTSDPLPTAVDGSASAAQPDALIDIREVVRLTSLSKFSVYRLIQRGRFPASVELTPGGRRVAWRTSEVSAWCRAPLEWGEQLDF